MEMQVVALFAQFQNRPPPPQFDTGVNLVSIVFQCGISLVMLVVQVLYLLNIYQTLDKVSPRNRDMEPGMVFLSLIPIFGLVWNFFVVIRLTESLRKEYRDRGKRAADEGFGYGAGLTMAIGACLCCFPVYLGGLITHWVQVSKYKAQIAGPSRGGRDEDNYDDEDDRPRRRTRRPRDEDDE